MGAKQDIRALSLEQLQDFFVSVGSESFRAKQVYQWLWGKSVYSFDQMTNISGSLCKLMQEKFVINHIRVDRVQRSTDGTIKNAIKLYDGNMVESVLIPTETRSTACVSSQVGCSLDCNFCATARLKRMRNLNADEIYDQVVVINKQSKLYQGRSLSNIVYMGMGEPLMNYKNVMRSIDKITSAQGLGMSQKRITLSTVGIAHMIERMADENVKFNLALSLHSAVDETRSRLMPINFKIPLNRLASSLKHWYSKTGRKVTYEYVVWKDINDNQKHIDALIKFCKIIPCKVNLIEYNRIDNGEFISADGFWIDGYADQLRKAGYVANIRNSRGKDIDAACGQLANKSFE